MVLLQVLIILILLNLLFGSKERFSGSPATITQLSANSGLPIISSIRPVRQRGIYFGNPSWHR